MERFWFIYILNSKKKIKMNEKKMNYKILYVKWLLGRLKDNVLNY